ncbi:MAG: amidophosphoribosyltransferase, partial [Phycisphaerae bacterium]|nr:amidophosphoribosyltransferase [Phycisphaerae bacterium]
ETKKIDDDCIVVPVPDTAKAAADAYAYKLGIPCVEGLMRNRYVGRTFIQSGDSRQSSVNNKYTPLPRVLKGKRVFVVEDSIVRSTTLRRLVGQIRDRGKAKEIHVRVASPPIVAPCFYGIDMSTLGELFAPEFIPPRYKGNADEKMMREMAKTLKLDSLKYLSVPDIAKCLKIPLEDLCCGCVTGKYPTLWGNKLMTLAKRNINKTGRTYES